MNILKSSAVLLFLIFASAGAQTNSPKPMPADKGNPTTAKGGIPPTPVPSPIPSLTTRSSAPPNPFARPSKTPKQVPAPESIRVELPLTPPTLPSLPTPETQEATTEDIQAVKIGEVNGLSIYKGNNIYHFEVLEKDKTRRRVVPPSSRDAFLAATTIKATNGVTQTSGPVNLPSSVGTSSPPTQAPQPATKESSSSSFSGTNSKPFDTSKTAEKSTFPKF